MKFSARTSQFIVLFSLVALFSSPFLLQTAQAYTAPGIPYWAQKGLISCTGDYSGTLSNPSGVPPCRSLCDLLDTFVNIIYFVITIAMFILAPILFLIGGIMMMISGANPEMLSQGKKILTGTVIGLVIVLVAYLIVFTFVNFLGISGVGGFSNGGGVFHCNAG